MIASLDLTNGGSFIVIGILLILIAGIWTIVVAAQRSILWLVAVILVPFANLVLVIVESKARLPFVISLIGVGFTFWGVSEVEREPESNDAWARQLVHSTRRQKAEAPPATLEARKARIREWQAQLHVKRAALQPNDAAERAEFDREFQQYLKELEKVKAEMAAQRAQ